MSDVVNEVTGNFGKWQLRAILIIFLCKIPAVWFLSIILFTAPAPKSGDFWCLPPDNITNHTEWILQSHPIRKYGTDKEFQIDFCRVYKDAYDDKTIKFFQFAQSDNISVRENRKVMPCVNFHFNSDFHSVINEYKLVCSRRLLANLSQSLHILGLLIGGILAHFMLKRFSPKTVMLVGMLAQVFFGAMCGQTKFFELHALLRCLVAACCSAMVASGQMIIVMHKEKEENGMLSHMHHHDTYRSRELGVFENGLLDGEMFLQALNGFLMILTCEGEVFFATHSIESYLGFHQENMFKSKHKLDFSLVSMDQRGKSVLGYSDSELANMGGYDLVHYDDLAYVASAHQELLKTGASGMIAYRYQKKDGEWQWLQTSSRLVYKNSKPDFVICTHRQLMDEEGRDLLGKRTMDFKVSYLDTGLASTYFSESDQLIIPPSGSPNSLPAPVTPQRTTRRYKTQLRDFLSTCRSKRKLQQQTAIGQVTPPAPVVDYIADPAAAVAAAYSNLNPMYSASPYAPTADNIYMTPSVHSSNFYPVTDNLFHQYRLQGVSGYYPEYHHSPASASYVANGFLSYDGYGIPTKEEKWQEGGKYYSSHEVSSRSVYAGYGSPTGPTQMTQPTLKTPKSSPPVMEVAPPGGQSPVTSRTPSNPLIPATNSSTNNPTPNPINATANTQNGSSALAITPKVEHSPPEHYERQTVLMWGSASNSNSSHRSPSTTPTSNGMYNENHHMKLSNQMVMSPVMDDHHNAHLKWNGGSKGIPSSEVQVYQIHPHQDVDGSMYAHVSQSPHLSQHSGHIVASDQSTLHHSPQNHHHHSVLQSQQQQSIGSSCEVWSPAYSQYQYFTYHHAPQHASTQSSLVDTTQSHCLSRSNGYMEPSHHQHGTISPISPLTQLSHTHPSRTPITRTGVLCCPSLR